jgi:hypothetical protein
MSWMPDQDPVPGDRRSCDALDLVIVPRARLMYLVGSALEGPRHMWWNFVSSRKDRIEEARQDWKAGRLRPVPGETEFIPLPSST